MSLSQYDDQEGQQAAVDSIRPPPPDFMQPDGVPDFTQPLGPNGEASYVYGGGRGYLPQGQLYQPQLQQQSQPQSPTPGLWTIKGDDLCMLPGVSALVTSPAKPFSDTAKAFIANGGSLAGNAQPAAGGGALPPGVDAGAGDAIGDAAGAVAAQGMGSGTVQGPAGPQAGDAPPSPTQPDKATQASPPQGNAGGDGNDFRRATADEAKQYGMKEGDWVLWENGKPSKSVGAIDGVEDEKSARVDAGLGEAVDSNPAPVAPPVKPAMQPATPPLKPPAPIETEANFIRQKYEASQIDKPTAMRLLATIGQRPPENALDEAGKIAYETAKSGTEMAGGMAAAPFGAALGAFGGPVAPVTVPLGGAAAYAGGSYLTRQAIEHLEDYLAGKSDTFAAGLAEQQNAPYAQAIGQTIPLVALAGGSTQGYLALAKKGLGPVLNKAIPSALGMGGANTVITGATQGRLPTWRETRDALITGALFGGTGPGEKLSKVTHPKLVEAFGPDYPADEYGMPVPPRVLPDNSPLLRETYNWNTGARKPTAEIPTDHPLVTEGLLKPGTVSRQELHDAIIEHFVRQGTPLTEGQKPVAYVTGGGGGSGKSSLLADLNNEGRIKTSGAVVVNSDYIKALLPEYDAIQQTGDSRGASVVQNESSFIADKLRDAITDPNRAAKYNLIYDTTLSNPENARQLFNELKQNGYETHLIGVTIDPQEGMARAFIRGKKEGRWVPSKVLARNHQQFNVALKSYLPLVDQADIWDNTLEKPREVAKKQANSQVEIINHSLYNTINERGK